MQPNIHRTENAKQALARVTNAYVRLQLATGYCISPAIVHAHHSHETDENKVSLLAIAAMRATHEMAIARALGDKLVPRLDELVHAQVRELFGADFETAVRGKLLEMGGDWRGATDWPAPLAVPPLPSVRIRRISWWQRFTAWLLGDL